MTDEKIYEILDYIKRTADDIQKQLVNLEQKKMYLEGQIEMARVIHTAIEFDFTDRRCTYVKP